MLLAPKKRHQQYLVACRRSGQQAAAADRHENYDTISPIKNKKKRAVVPPFARGRRADGLAIVMKTNRSELDRSHVHSGIYEYIHKKAKSFLIKKKREKENMRANSWAKRLYLRLRVAPRESVRIPSPGV